MFQIASHSVGELPFVPHGMRGESFADWSGLHP